MLIAAGKKMAALCRSPVHLSAGIHLKRLCFCALISSRNVQRSTPCLSFLFFLVDKRGKILKMGKKRKDGRTEQRMERQKYMH